MVRTQIQLTEEQSRKLKRLAAREGVSVAEAVRRLIDTSAGDGETALTARYERAAALVGAFRDRDGATDVASEHDRYLAEVFNE